MPTKVTLEGIRLQGAAFCYPASLAHGLFLDLIRKNPDFIFLPQVSEIYVKNAITKEPEHQSTCFILQAEPYYLQAAFKGYLIKDKLITPVLNFSQGLKSATPVFLRIGRKLGKKRSLALKAYRQAYEAQERFIARLKKSGEEILENLNNNPEEIAIIIFGRPYNAFCPDMNLGIPNKFASRGLLVIPFDLLPFETSDYKGPPDLFGRNLTWAFGQMLIKAASFVKQHERLFGVYITNFSCGPDSFLVTYFRDIMKDKPSLTIEIDSHTADAGVDTRIEAFLDIVQRYRHLKKLNVHFQASLAKDFHPAQIIYRGKKAKVMSSDNKIYSLTDPRVRLLIPSMGDLGTQVLTAAFNRIGIHATAMAVPDNEVLQYGKAYSSGKECLPLILTSGSLMQYLQAHRNKNEVILYFMPTVGGNCRFSQYGVFINNLIRKNHLKDVAIFPLTSENSYMGLGNRFMITVLKAAVISDAMDDIRSTLCVLAKDKEYAQAVFTQEWQKTVRCIQSHQGVSIERQLVHSAQNLKKIPLRYPIEEARVVSLLGEIFIRKEVFSRKQVVEKLQKNDFIPKAAPVLEWLYYVDHPLKKGIVSTRFSIKSKAEFFIKHSLQHLHEHRIKRILAESGLYPYYSVDMANLLKYGSNLVPLELTGEPIVVIGAALSEKIHSICGVVSIGPFNCLPTRVTEAVLSREMTMERKRKIENIKTDFFSSLSGLPFLSIEVDGNPLSPVTEARLEAFCLQAEKVHHLMKAKKREKIYAK